MSTQNTFIETANRLILEQVGNEQFGVSELAEAMHMSRSNLLRKIKKETDLSASQYIRKVRLQRGMELLQEDALRVSEVAYAVGFGSVSYFIKCFREEYGYPPGEVGKRSAAPAETDTNIDPDTDASAPSIPPEEQPVVNEKEGFSWKLVAAVVLVLVAVAASLMIPGEPDLALEVEKSIAVLPFNNESADSSNRYFVNGLMASTLGNLQKIQDLRVISRTSSEKYRNSGKSVPEIAEELKVAYVVEGSGQRVGDQVLLNIQLIEAATDRPIWTEQYSREVTDIFDLQNEVAREIAKAIEAVVTPSELALLAKKPTENLEAYDLYLQAMGPFQLRTKEGLEIAIPLFEEAIAHDEQFALAYANIAIAYYFLDFFQSEKHYTEEINRYSDQALLHDPKSDVCLTAKAFYYLHIKENRLALPHLEKALEYNPNSASAVKMLADYYAWREPNTSKYLEYSLMGVKLDAMEPDSIARSFGYLHLSNALVQTGFFDEALYYVEEALAYNPDNYFAPHLTIFVQYAQHRDAERTQQQLSQLWKKDTNRMEVLQDLAKIFYVQSKWDSAYHYYQIFNRKRESQNLQMFTHENAKIAFVYNKKGQQEKAKELFAAFVGFCEEDESLYKSANQAIRYAYEQDLDRALEELELFSKQGDFQYWYLLIEDDPMMAPLHARPEFSTVLQKIKDRFWQDHEKLRATLEEEGLLQF